MCISIKHWTLHIHIQRYIINHKTKNQHKDEDRRKITEERRATATSAAKDKKTRTHSLHVGLCSWFWYSYHCTRYPECNMCVNIWLISIWRQKWPSVFEHEYNNNRNNSKANAIRTKRNEMKWNEWKER